jgi:leucine-rich repeat protein SHOC2
MSHNHIESLPENIGDLNKLKKLGLKYNQLKTMPVSMANLTKLEEFNIEGNNVLELDEKILKSCVELQIVVISRNRFSALPNMESLSKLIRIDGSHNEIIMIPSDSFKQPKLIWVSLKGNKIGSLPEDIKNWNSIKELDLSSNSIGK